MNLGPLVIYAVILIFVLIYSVKKLKSTRAIIKRLSIFNIVIISLWAVLLVLLITKVLPLEVEVLVNGECCAYFEQRPSVWLIISMVVPIIPIVASVFLHFKSTQTKKEKRK